jgi:cullin 1
LGLNKEKPKETTLDVYKEAFEEDFLNATEVYYTAESVQFISQNTVADYMKKVEARLQEELVRVRQYLHPSTETELINKCDRVLIEKHVESIWTEFQHLLEDDKVDGMILTSNNSNSNNSNSNNSSIIITSIVIT